MTERQRNLKPDVSLRKRIKYFPSTLRIMYCSNSNVFIRDYHGSFWIARSGKPQDYRDIDVFKMLSFEICFVHWHLNANPPFSNSSSFKSVFKKLRWMAGLWCSVHRVFILSLQTYAGKNKTGDVCSVTTEGWYSTKRLRRKTSSFRIPLIEKGTPFHILSKLALIRL